jgi:hypothetical protein
MTSVTNIRSFGGEKKNNKIRITPANLAEITKKELTNVSGLS